MTNSLHEELSLLREKMSDVDLVAGVLLHEYKDVENIRNLVVHFASMYLRWVRSDINNLRDKRIDANQIQNPDFASEIVLFCAKNNLNLFQSDMLKEMVIYTEELRLNRASKAEGHIYIKHSRANPEGYCKNKHLEPVFYSLWIQSKNNVPLKAALESVYKTYKWLNLDKDILKQRYKDWKKNK